MPLDDQPSWALLRELDDPDHLEFPRGYNHTASRARFNQLAHRLNLRFDCICTVDRGVQDASHHGTIVIPDAATVSVEHITVTVSNFGSLAAVSLGNPGSYDEEEEREFFQSADRYRIDAELKALGYVAISPHLLWTRYDGVSQLASSCPRPPEHPPTWWTRFFDYL
ncbi:hypothetical protein [Streptomyces sp. PR69]|uniref:hypothetical protein n=1 Tax=Streptomyces sp. PR69 TaxID=2984950 RepID=UPI002265139B|nr:hypothetical protein [Streptomyces sp. PR69]